MPPTPAAAQQGCHARANHGVTATALALCGVLAAVSPLARGQDKGQGVDWSAMMAGGFPKYWGDNGWGPMAAAGTVDVQIGEKWTVPANTAPPVSVPENLAAPRAVLARYGFKPSPQQALIRAAFTYREVLATTTEFGVTTGSVTWFATVPARQRGLYEFVFRENLRPQKTSGQPAPFVLAALDFKTAGAWDWDGKPNEYLTMFRGGATLQHDWRVAPTAPHSIMTGRGAPDYPTAKQRSEMTWGHFADWIGARFSDAQGKPMIEQAGPDRLAVQVTLKNQVLPGHNYWEFLAFDILRLPQKRLALYAEGEYAPSMGSDPPPSQSRRSLEDARYKDDLNRYYRTMWVNMGNELGFHE